MCRYGDTGPYALDNIYKDTLAANSRSMRLRVLARKEEACL